MNCGWRTNFTGYSITSCMGDCMEEIMNILSKYDKDDLKVFTETIDMLCSKGIAYGCYQDYTMLTDIIRILGICKRLIQ